MNLKQQQWVISIIVILFLIASACVQNASKKTVVTEDESLTQIPTPTLTFTATSTPIPTPIPTPKYAAGDIVRSESLKPSPYDAEIILGYDPDTDKYATTSFFKDDRSKSWENGHMISKEWYGWSRTLIEGLYPIKIDHIDPNGLKLNDGTSVPAVTPPYPKYNSINEQGLPKSGNYIRVNYDNYWSGTISSLKSSKSVNGIFQNDFSVDKYGSGCFSKQDGSSNLLRVEVIQNGKIVRSETTTNPYGVVCISV
jgi:hypothetical protein